MNSWRAADLHLLISAGIAAVVLTLMPTVWYPRPPLRRLVAAFEADGVKTP